MNHQTRSRRTKIMGIVNVTPDSFSDGGKWERPGDAIKHGLDLIEQGADILDIGGESTRPGATPVPIVEEQRRVIPVIRELAQSGAIVSIDTYNAETAIAAAEAGARIVNDVSGGLADPLMASTVAALQVDYIATHWRGHLNGHTNTHYDDVVSDVSSELSARVAALLTAGVDPSKIHIDPGLGFSKDPSANWQILAHLKRFVDLGYPVLVGASRKRFVQEAALAASTEGQDLREETTTAISMVSAIGGVWGVRVHEVPATRAAFEVLQRLEQHRDG